MPFAHFDHCGSSGPCECHDQAVELIIRAIEINSRNNASHDESVARLEVENAARLENVTRLRMEVGSVRAMVRSLRAELDELGPQLLLDQTEQAAAANAVAAAATIAATIIIMATMVLLRRR